ncbi:MAG TPA: DNA repair protein RecO [Candidatus Baltobacteraceae bacterium]|nr:DNA repair protein RecO [Candidatus Baltobacteraceae bacterium]
MSAPQRSYKASAVILRGRTYGEADRILTLYTKECGKIDAIAKGARRTKSHLAGRLEFGNEVELGMHRGRNLDVVVSADIIEPHWQRLVQPERFAAANIIVELIDAFCEPDLAQPEIYELLTAALGAAGRSDDPLALLPRFSMRLLEALGLAPPVHVCIHCGKSLEGASAWLDAEQGGFGCEACRVNWRDALCLEADDVRNLQAVAAPPGGAVTPALRATRRVAQAIETLVNHHLGRRPKAGVHALEFVRGA